MSVHNAAMSQLRDALAALERLKVERDAARALEVAAQEAARKSQAERDEAQAERDAARARAIASEKVVSSVQAERDAARAGEFAAQAERDAARAAQAAAQAQRDATQAREVAALELAFKSDMTGICSSVFCAVSGTDEAQCGGLSAQVIDDFIDSLFPPVAASDVAAAWQCFRRKIKVSWRAPTVGTTHPDDNKRLVRDVVHWMLDAAMPNMNPCDLRLFGNITVIDGVEKTEAAPDFSFTHVRDSHSSLLGSVFLVEVELPNDMASAESQSRAFARRRVLKLFDEARSRGEAGDTVCSVVAGTDGREVTFSRVLSGAPPPGGSFAGLSPCPTTCSTRLALLPGWNGVSRPEPPAVPPPGFAALVRVLRAPIDRLDVNGAPLASLRARWLPGDGAPAAQPPVDEELTLDMCIGRGGTSDVFSAVGHADSAIKAGRYTSAAMVKAYKAEERALLALHDTAGSHGLVPILVRHGERVMSHTSVHSCPWPLLELSPAGVPLEQWLRDPTHDATDLCETADAVVSRVVAALALAHERMIVHCDVRPSNVIIADGKAVLVDWGVSRDVGTDCAGVGVAAYAVDDVYLKDTYAARPSQDFVAAAFLWLSIALGRGRAPWVGAPCSVEEDIGARAKWLQRSDRVTGSNERVANVVSFIRGRCEDATGRLTAAEAVAAAVALWPPQP